jgi:hypothetical protein
MNFARGLSAIATMKALTFAVAPSAMASAKGPLDGLPATNEYRCFSPNGHAQLVWQHDGNLVVYDENNKARWASGTAGVGQAFLYEPVGNAIIWDVHQRIIWSTGTAGHPNDSLSPNVNHGPVCQNDGNVVIYDGTTPLWSTRTAH